MAYAGRKRDNAGLVLGASMVLTGLVAGLYYAFACAVMIGLADTGDRTFVDSMQRINEGIQNPVFLLSFLGAFAIPIAAAVMQKTPEAKRWIWIALALYTITLITTFAINIPLNDDLDAASLANAAAAREDFEDPWVVWNIVRAVLATAALGALGRALVLHGRGR